MDARVGASTTKTYSSNEWLRALELGEDVPHGAVEEGTHRPHLRIPYDHLFAEP